jgi:beta-lactamase superfamily II metal-dependent hydrolase
MPTSGKPYQRAKQTAAAAETLAMTPVRRRWLFALGPLLALAGTCAPAEETCGSGSWRPGRLEIHHFDLGQADSTLIVSPTGQSLLVDLGEAAADSAEGASRVGRRLREILGCRTVDQAVITHFHVDHAGAVGTGGLWHLIHRQGFRVGTTWHRNLWAFAGDGGAQLGRWRGHLGSEQGKALNPRVIAAGAVLDLGPQVELRVVAVDGAGALRSGDFGPLPAPPSENDYSVGLRLRFGRLDYFLGGDLSGEHLVGPAGAFSYHDVETRVAPAVGDVDVYRVNHHGSAHSSNLTWLGQLDPAVSIVSVGANNPHGHPHPATLQRLLSRGAVYLTGRGDPRTPLGAARVSGDVAVVSGDGLSFTVAGDPYQASDPLRIDGDGDGYFQQVDPDDWRPAVRPAPFGGCDPSFQACAVE